MTKKQIFDKKQYGDIKVVAQMIGVTRHNAARLLERPTAKRHNEAVKALEQVVAAREKLQKQANISTKTA